MDINSIPKKYLLGIIGTLVVVLLLVTFLQPTSYRYSANSPSAVDQAKSDALRKQYADYLASIKTDPDASKQLFKQLVSEQEVEQQVATTLQVNQKVTIPDVPSNRLNIVASNGETPVRQYFQTVQPVIDQFNNNLQPLATNLFSNQDQEQAALQTLAALDQMYKVPVPAEALAYHKAEINSMEQILGVVKTAEATNNADSEDPAWPQMYRQYAVINNQTSVAKDEFNRLDQKYALSSPKNAVAVNGVTLIKTANAQFAVVDIWQKIEIIAKQVLAAGFAKFMNLFLDKMISTIENNYYIANFLYYTDALVRGQYTTDYLDKYVADAIDRQIIQRFIPQFSCASGNKQDLGQIFVAKARQYLGFDPAAIDPNSTDFYSKMSRLPALIPEEQELNYRGAAEKAMIEANQAAILEQLSPNATKLPRSDALSKQISETAASISLSLQAAFNAKLGLGTSNTDSLVANIVSSAIDQFANKYIFKGVVLKEQSTCIELPQLQPVIPAESTPPFVGDLPTS